MYCGGGQLILEGDLIASAVDGTVVDPSGTTVPLARVQVQRRGSDIILKELHADDNGKFRIHRLAAGEYWLGVSYPGLNLHCWHLTVKHRAGRQRLRVTLTIGT
jgi:hypothetical protein